MATLPTKPAITEPPSPAPHKRGQNPVAFDDLMQPFVNWVCSKWFPDAKATIEYMGVVIELTANTASDAAAAKQAALDATAAFEGMRTVYLGARDVAPSTAPGGGPIAKGAFYLNTTAGAWYWWDGAAWQLGLSNPAAGAVAWGNVHSTPSTVEGYGITNAVKLVDFTFAKLQGKPATLAGYGITDALLAANFRYANLPDRPTTVAAAGLTDAVTTVGAQMISGQKSFTNGITLGSSISPSVTDLSKHISLYAGVYGFSLSGSRINYVCPVYARHYFVIDGKDMGYVGESGFVSTGDVTAYSDERLKKSWKPLAPGFVEQLAGVKHGTYTRIDTGQRQVGVSAQALQKILSEAVQVVDDDKQLLGVAYGNAALVACVQLAQRVLQQEERIKVLEAKR